MKFGLASLLSMTFLFKPLCSQDAPSNPTSDNTPQKYPCAIMATHTPNLGSEGLNKIWFQVMTTISRTMLDDMANKEWFVYEIVFTPNDSRNKGGTTIGNMTTAKCNVLLKLTYNLVTINSEKNFQFSLAVMKTNKEIASYLPGDGVKFATLFKKDYSFPQNEEGLKACDPVSLGHSMFSDLKAANMLEQIGKGNTF